MPRINRGNQALVKRTYARISRIGRLVRSLRCTRDNTRISKVYHEIQNRRHSHTHGYKSSRKWGDSAEGRRKMDRETERKAAWISPRRAHRASRSVFLYEVPQTGRERVSARQKADAKRNERLIYRMSTFPDDNHAGVFGLLPRMAISEMAVRVRYTS